MTVSLQFYTDAALTLPVSTTAINHLLDGSNDPQDFLFYLGSVAAANKFQNNNNPGVDNLIVDITNATALWLASTGYLVNASVRTTAKNGYRYKVQSIVATGITGVSEPVWPLTVGAIIVDNEVTWVNDGKIHESNEVKLALSSVGLDSAAAGANLVIGVTVNGGSVNAVAVHMRIDDATAIIGQVTELLLKVLNVVESPI